jgi:hypothetical protein
MNPQDNKYDREMLYVLKVLQLVSSRQYVDVWYRSEVRNRSLSEKNLYLFYSG